MYVAKSHVQIHFFFMALEIRLPRLVFRKRMSTTMVNTIAANKSAAPIAIVPLRLKPDGFSDG